MTDPTSGRLNYASAQAILARRKRSHDIQAETKMNSRTATANVIINPPQPMELLGPLTSPKRSKSSSKVLTHWWIKQEADVN